MYWRENLRGSRFVQLVVSLKLVTILLLILFFLVFFGTLYQVEFGLLKAQERYFNSLYFFAFGWIPMPGASLILCILALSLIFFNVIYLKYFWRNIGLILIHWTVFFFLFSFFLTYLFSKSGYMTLSEGAASFFMRHPYRWDFIIYDKKDFSHTKKINLLDLKENAHFQANALDFNIKKIEANAKIFYIPEKSGGKKVLSVSGMNVFVNDKSKRDPQKYVPAVEVELRGETYMLYGDDDEALKLDDEISLRLMPQTEALPIGLRLVEVKQENYENTVIAKSYESTVEITEKNTPIKKVKISMNEPYRYRGYSIFQNGYYLDPAYQTKYSTFEIAYNPFYFLPYWLTIFLFLGASLHFIIVFLVHNKKRVNAGKI